jgi:nitrogen regulatory protein P-II 1
MAQDNVTLIKIEAIVREESYIDVKNALDRIGVNGITVYQVVGCGIQRGMSEYVRGQKVDIQVVPKIKFEIVVSSEEWEQKTIEAIQKAACTGNKGDGKIFSYYIKQAIKIRTGETGYDAIQSVKETKED